MMIPSKTLKTKSDNQRPRPLNKAASQAQVLSPSFLSSFFSFSSPVRPQLDFFSFYLFMYLLIFIYLFLFIYLFIYLFIFFFYFFFF